MSDVQISVTETDVQIAVIDQENTQLALAAPDETQVSIAVPGVQGPKGEGVPIGGSANQVLFKQSGTNYDTAWSNVTSAMIGDLQIVDADIATNAEIAVSKLADGAARQLLQTDAAGTGVEWTDNVDVPGTLDVTGAATFDSTATITGVINANGKISFPLGTAALPSLYPGSDLNTGIYSPGADQLAISTAGTGRLFVDASGNVNIGNPLGYSEALGVRGTFASQVTNVVNRITEAGSVAYWGTVTNHPLAFQTNGQERMRLDSSGRLGIGTTSPQDSLHVIGQIRAAFAGVTKFVSLYPGDSVNSPAIGFSSADSLRFAGIAEFARIRADGMFEVKGAGTAGVSPAFSVSGSAPANSFVVDSSGRLGLGTSSPSSLLSLSGSSAYVVQNSGRALAGIDLQATAGGSGLFGGAVSFGVGGTGRAAIAAIQSTSDNDVVGLGFFGHNSGTAAADAVEYMRIDGSTGRVGIGTASPRSLLNVRVDTNANTASGSASLVLSNRSTSLATGNMAGGIFADMYRDISDPAYAAGIWFNRVQTTGNLDSAGEIVFGVQSVSSGAGTPPERLRIDSSGRLLVGTSTARQNWFNGTSLAPQVQIEGAGLGARLSIVRNDASANGHGLILGKTRGSSYEIVSAEDPVGYVSFQGADGAELVEAARIETVIDGTPGANNMPGRIVLSTTSNGATSPTERLRITSAGVLQIADAGNISVGTTTGTKIGTATTQKLGFFNKTPVVQPTAVADATDAASVITQLNALLARMRDLGLIAT